MDFDRWRFFLVFSSEVLLRLLARTGPPLFTSLFPPTRLLRPRRRRRLIGVVTTVVPVALIFPSPVHMPMRVAFFSLLVANSRAQGIDRIRALTFKEEISMPADSSLSFV